MRRLTLLGAVLVAACGANDGPGADVDPAPADTTAAAEVSAEADPGATADLLDTAGNVVGQARFTQVGDGVQVQLEVTSLPPGTHGVHIHETGQCDAGGETAFASAGGHLNPDGREHGLENPNGPHAGDLPNIEIGADGSGSLDSVAARGVADGIAGVILDADGAAIMVHANRDDMITDDGPDGPGNSGGRIACGVITR